MCGLSGIIYKNSTPNQKHIFNMNGMINHRGPNQFPCFLIPFFKLTYILKNKNDL